MFRLQWAGFSHLLQASDSRKVNRLKRMASRQNFSDSRRPGPKWDLVGGPNIKFDCFHSYCLVSTPQTSKAAYLEHSQQAPGNWTETGKGEFQLPLPLFFALGRVDRIITRNWKFHWWVLVLAFQECQKASPKLGPFFIHSVFAPVCPPYPHPCPLCIGFAVDLSVDMSCIFQFSTDNLDVHLPHLKQF